MTRCLIVGCSKRKVSQAALLPAVERYDGPVFRVLRKFHRERPLEAFELDVYVVSARFGLLDGDEPIPDYDQSMQPDRARALRPMVLRKLEDALDTRDYSDLCLCLGREYQPAISGIDEIVPPGVSVTVIDGSIGGRQSALKRWLNRGMEVEEGESRYLVKSGSALLRGRSVSVSADEVAAIVRRSLPAASPRELRLQTWYAEVDGHYLPVKWLVSQLFGLSPSRFRSSEARRVLAQLGVKVLQSGS